MKRTLLLTVAAVITVSLPATGGPIMLTFEEPGVPDIIGDFYAPFGVYFDPVWRLTSASGTWPSHSGRFTVSTISGASAGVITFEGPVSSVSGWFTTSSPNRPALYLEAYTGPAGTGMFIALDWIDLRNEGVMVPMEVCSAANDIMSVVLRDSGNGFTLDDLCVQPVPEPTTMSILLAGIACAGLRQCRIGVKGYRG